MKSDSRAQAKRPPGAMAPRNNRAAVSNGRLLPRGVDARSSAGRRWKDLFRNFTAQLPGGAPTVGQEVRLRALVGVTVALEELTARQAAGKPVDHTELVALANSQGRMLSELGLVPKPEPEREPGPPSLAEYLAATREERP